MAKSTKSSKTTKTEKTTKAPKANAEENISLQELLFSPKARRKLTAQLKDRLTENVLDTLVKNDGKNNPILEQLLNRDRK
jgi:hypothetical protein